MLSQPNDPEPASLFTFRGKTVRLSPLEARLWEGLQGAGGEWRTRHDFLRHVWRGEDPANTKSINVLVHQLRENIIRQAGRVEGYPGRIDMESRGAAETMIQTSTKRGQGWRLRPDVEHLAAVADQPRRKWI